VIQTDFRMKCTVHVIKHFVLKISWIGFLSNVAIKPEIRHTATAPYFIHWYTYTLSVLIYRFSDMVVQFITWVRESMISGGGLSHGIGTNICCTYPFFNSSYDFTIRCQRLDRLAYLRTPVLQSFLYRKMQSFTSSCPWAWQL